jgi:hypothetical protein
MRPARHSLAPQPRGRAPASALPPGDYTAAVTLALRVTAAVADQVALALALASRLVCAAAPGGPTGPAPAVLHSPMTAGGPGCRGTNR